MKRILIAAVMLGLGGGAYAADFGDLGGLRAARIKALAAAEGIVVPEASKGYVEPTEPATPIEYGPETRSSYDPGLAATQYMYLIEEAVPLLEKFAYVPDSLNMVRIRIERGEMVSLPPDINGLPGISQQYCDLIRASLSYRHVDEALSKKVLPALNALGPAPASSHALDELLSVLPLALRSANTAGEATPDQVRGVRFAIELFPWKDTDEMLMTLKDIEALNSRILKNLAVARRLVYNLSASPLSK